MGRVLKIVGGIFLSLLLLWFLLDAGPIGIAIWLAMVVSWFVAWRRGAFRPESEKVRARMEKGDAPPLIVTTYSSDKDFERDAAAMEQLGYRIESRHITSRRTSRTTTRTEWHVTYARVGDRVPELV